MQGIRALVGLVVALVGLMAGAVAPSGSSLAGAWPAYARTDVQAGASAASTVQSPPTAPATLSAAAPAPSTQTPAPQAKVGDGLALGVIVDTTNPTSMRLAREAGFSYAKMVLHWRNVEPKRGRYAWLDTTENDLDNLIKAARAENMRLVIRVDSVPDWAGGSPSKVNLDAVEAFYVAMAAHARGAVAAYEVLNEPNLPFEWGGAPSPSGYAAFMKAAYRGVKKSDPNALVLGGGLSPATGGAGGTIDDLDFLRGMYAAGVRGSMDAFTIHNYGGNTEPERDPGSCGICFRRAELYRQVMVEQGDGATPIWASEYGWLMDPGRNMGQYDWMKVSADQQADYLVRSFRYARANWPWMSGLLVSNLDASTSPYHTGPQDGMPWFAILNKDHSPRPAWRAIKAWREQDLAQAAAQRAAAPPSVGAAAVTTAGAPTSTGTPTSTGDVAPVATPGPANPAAATVPQSSDGSQAAAVPAPANASAADVETAASPTDAPAAGSVSPPADEANEGSGAVAAIAPPFETAAAAQAAAAPERRTTTPSPAATDTAASVSDTPAPRVRVTRTDGAGVNLRARPSASSTALMLLPEGAPLDVVGADVQAEGRTWRNVRTSTGRTGWVAAQYLSAS
ncbi:MAG: SH3 domain-containing protein [Chloroflexi bacterium]|nr:SH3 domain-containing protein [Chloroflexota bacterium]